MEIEGNKVTREGRQCAAGIRNPQLQRFFRRQLQERYVLRPNGRFETAAKKLSASAATAALEDLVGPAHISNLQEGMVHEHCKAPDSSELFTDERGVTTTSAIEWQYVMSPFDASIGAHAHVQFPGVRAPTAASSPPDESAEQPATPGKVADVRSQLRPPPSAAMHEEQVRKMKDVNSKLRSMNTAQLMEEEYIAGPTPHRPADPLTSRCRSPADTACALIPSALVLPSLSDDPTSHLHPPRGLRDRPTVRLHSLPYRSRWRRSAALHGADGMEVQ